MTPGGGDGGGMLTLQEAADRLGVHYMTAYRYVRTGRLHATRDGGRWSVAPADVDALSDLRGETPGLTGRPQGSGHGADDGDDGVDRYRERLLGRLLAGDEAGAWRVVESALVARMRPDRAHLDLLAPCLREVGERWAAGTLSVGGEHVATVTAARLAARLAPLRARRGRTRGTVVVAGAPGPARDLGLAFQLTNFMRDVGEDLDRGRVYLPAEDIRRFGADVEARVVTPAWRDLMRFETARAQELYASADEGIALLPRWSARAIRAARVLYAGILDEIAARDYDVFTGRARVPTTRKLAVAAGSLLRR
jgi:excisionase family DNA binding protein